MSDLPITPKRWRDVLDTALEHGSHAWHALQKAGLAHVQDVDRQTWPPQCTDEVGSTPYHMAAMIRYVFEVYSGIFSMYPDDEDDDTGYCAECESRQKAAGRESDK